jgi:hypothetical protein
MTVNKQEQQLTHLQCIQKNHMHDFSKLLFHLSTILHPSPGQQKMQVPLLDFASCWGEVMDELCNYVRQKGAGKNWRKTYQI